MSSIWGLVALGVVAAIVGRIAWWQRRGRPSDLGVVSQQWVAEQRQSQKQDSQR